jgi:hypothetical protein
MVGSFPAPSSCNPNHRIIRSCCQHFSFSPQDLTSQARASSIVGWIHEPGNPRDQERAARTVYVRLPL